MSTLKLLIIMAVASCLSISFYGCSSNAPGNNSSSSNTVETSKPVQNTVYDVICVGVQSCLSDISKVPRGTTISLYTKTESSVQQGSKESLYIKTTKDRVGISESEMEILAEKGANVYSFMNIMGCLSVHIYKKGQGFVKIEEKEYKIDFVAGDTTGGFKITNPACFAFKYNQQN
jgi:hypothetical protein